MSLKNSSSPNLLDLALTGNGGSDNSIESISILEEMKRSYLDYSMSVIVSRALPDVRDGLKPVHRRILYAMKEMGLEANKPYRKSAAVVGEVMGKYHPHGDSSIYEALVRMAQDFSLRVPLIDGQGNFGSVDGDPAAAMRYTECRFDKLAAFMLADIDKDTVDFQDNYDGREQEPKLLPARFPNLLVNGAGGIAVGMATNIPPHNLGEVIDGCIALIDDPELSLDKLMQIIPGPDFPTGGLILGRSTVRSVYETGRGAIVMRARLTVEKIARDREAIIVTDIPYQVNKAAMLEKIASLVRDKRITGISDLRDESDRDGYRVVIELKRDAIAEIVLNQLYRYTPLQTSFNCNMVALNAGRPEQMSLLQILRVFIDFRLEVVSRRTKFLLRKARERAHILVGLAIAVANIDEIILIIRSASDPNDARQKLMAKAWPAGDIASLIRLIADPRHIIAQDLTYRLSLEQAQAILDLRLQRLTALGREEVADEIHKIYSEIADYLSLLASKAKMMALIKSELTEIRDRLPSKRRTDFAELQSEMEEEDLIASEDMVVTVSYTGYIKRVPLTTYRAQRRGGKGRAAMAMREEDAITRLFIANTHASLLFFSSHGMVYKEKVWRLPAGTPQSRGKALINLLPLKEGERITTILPLPVDEQVLKQGEVFFTTKRGLVRRNKLSDFVQVNRQGKIAMRFDQATDEILSVDTCDANDDIMLTTSLGRCIRFPVNSLRIVSGRATSGVRGIRLDKGDEVVSATMLKHVEASASERLAYLKRATAERSFVMPLEGEEEELAEGEAVSEKFAELTEARYQEMRDQEETLLIVSAYGYGKRASSYDFGIINRGGKGVQALDISKIEQTGKLVASFPVSMRDQIMLVTDKAQIIRVPVDQIRLARRATKGVTIFQTARGEKVVSVERISETEDVSEAITS